MSKKINNSKFNEFCNKQLDGLYDPNFNYEEQCIGYKKLKQMVDNDIEPANEKEMIRWENTPTLNEISSTPPLKYLRFIHVNLRPIVINNWQKIKK